MNNPVHIPIIVPEMGTEDETVLLSLWLADVGEYVLSGDRIVELVLGGIVFDVSAPVSGILDQIQVAENSVVQVGMCLGVIKQDLTDLEGD